MFDHFVDNRHYRVKTENVNRLITSLYLFVVLRMYLLLISLFIDLLFRVSICISFIYVLILSTPVIFLCIIFLLILTHFLVTDQHNNKICYFCAISTVLLNAIILSSTCLYFLVWYFSLLCGYLVFFSFMWLFTWCESHLTSKNWGFCNFSCVFCQSTLVSNQLKRR